MALIYITIGVTTLGFLMFWWFKRRKVKTDKHDDAVIQSENKTGEAKTGEPEIKSTTQPMGALVFDDISGTFYKMQLAGKYIDQIRNRQESLGRQWDYLGEKLIAVNRNLDGSYERVTPTVDFENPSSKLRRAITFPYNEYNWGIKKKSSFMAKYGGVLLFAGLCFAGVFLYMTK
jgi:hypothetical protein